MRAYFILATLLIFNTFWSGAAMGIKSPSDALDIMKVYKNFRKDKVETIDAKNLTDTENGTNGHAFSLDRYLFGKILDRFNDTSVYGSMKNPAISCKDLARKELLSNQPEPFFIKTIDDEVLEVFCPQTYTFIKADENIDFSSNITASIQNLTQTPNSTTIVVIDGAVNENSTTSTIESGNDGINIIRPEQINQTTSFNTMSPSESAKTKDYESGNENISEVSAKMLNQLESAENASIYNNTLPFSKIDPFSEVKNNMEPNNDSHIMLLGRSQIHGNSRKRTKINLIKTRSGKSVKTKKNIKLKDKMKIPLYTAVNNLFKFNKSNNKLSNQKKKVSEKKVKDSDPEPTKGVMKEDDNPEKNKANFRTKDKKKTHSN